MQILLGLMLILFSCNSEEGGDPVVNPIDRLAGGISQGNDIYDNNCLECHGEYAQGTSIAPDITNASDDEIYEALDIQTPEGMTSFINVFEDDELSDIAAYLESQRIDNAFYKARLNKLQSTYPDKIEP